MGGNSQALEEGIRLFNDGKPAEALPLLSEAVAADGQNPQARGYLGAALSLTGDHVGAIPHFSEAARLEPGQAKHHYNLGRALQAAGRTSEATGAYRRALALKPDSQRAKDALAALTERAAAAPASPKPAPPAPQPVAPWTQATPTSSGMPPAPAREAYRQPPIGYRASERHVAEKKASWVPAVVILLLLAIGIAAVVARPSMVKPKAKHTGDPAMVVQQYVAAQKVMDVDAIARVTSAASQEKLAALKVRLQENPMFAEQVKALYAMVTIEVGQATIDGDEAQVPLKVSVNNGPANSQRKVTIWCVWEAGGWKVNEPKTQSERKKEKLKGF